MKTLGLIKGLVHSFDTNDKRGRNSYFDLRKMTRDYLLKLSVPFYDPCCVDANTLGVVPVGFDSTGDGVLKRFNTATNTWVAISVDLTVDDLIADTISVTSGVTTASGAMIAAFYPSAAQNNIIAGTGGAIPVTNYLTTINTDADDDAFTLANGTAKGQMKKISLIVDGGGNGVVTPATAFAGGTTATFDDAGDFLILQWSGTAWLVLENSGVIIA